MAHRLFLILVIVLGWTFAHSSGASAAATTPGIPTIGAATALGSGASVSFTAPSSDGGAAITSYTVAALGSSNGGTSCTSVGFTAISQSNSVCGLYSAENKSVTLTAPAGENFTNVTYALYGTPTIVNGLPTAGTCNSTQSLGIVKTALIGKNTATFTEGNSLFGDPCNGTVKHFYVVATFSPLTATCSASPCVITGLTSGNSYNLAVAATNSIGTGTYSTTVAVTPKSVSTTSLTASAATYLSATTISVSVSPSSATGSVTVSDGTRSCVASLTSGAGSCRITEPAAGAVTFTGVYSGDGTYGSSVGSTSGYSVSPGALTITAASSSPVYGTAITPSVAASGLQGADAISSSTYTYAGTGATSYGPSTTAPTAVGSYTVTPSNAIFSSGSATNYTISYVAGSFTISSATLTITASNTTQVLSLIHI